MWMKTEKKFEIKLRNRKKLSPFIQVKRDSNPLSVTVRNTRAVCFLSAITTGIFAHLFYGSLKAGLYNKLLGIKYYLL